MAETVPKKRRSSKGDEHGVRSRQRELLTLLESKSQRCHELQRLLDSCEAKLRERDAEIRKMQLASYQTNYRINQLEVQMHARDKEISRLQQSTESPDRSTRKKNSEFSRQLHRQAEEIAAKDAQLQQMTAELDTLRSFLTASDATTHAASAGTAEGAQHSAQREMHVNELQARLAELELRSEEQSLKHANTQRDLSEQLTKLRETALQTEAETAKLREENVVLRGKLGLRPNDPLDSSSRRKTEQKVQPGQVAGVCMTIVPNHHGEQVIKALVKGGPAYACKRIHLGDILVNVDGTQLHAGMSSTAVKSLIVGPPGSQVSLTVLRRPKHSHGGNAQFISVRVNRALPPGAAAPPAPVPEPEPAPAKAESAATGVVATVEDRISMLRRLPSDACLAELEQELRRMASALQRSQQREETSVNLQRLVSDKIQELAAARQDAMNAMRHAVEVGQRPSAGGLLAGSAQSSTRSHNAGSHRSMGIHSTSSVSTVGAHEEPRKSASTKASSPQVPQANTTTVSM